MSTTSSRRQGTDPYRPVRNRRPSLADLFAHEPDRSDLETELHRIARQNAEEIRGDEIARLERRRRMEGQSVDALAEAFARAEQSGDLTSSLHDYTDTTEEQNHS
jgi:hypothetical protein